MPARSNGHEPGFCMIPPLDMATTVFVAEDVDRAWDELGRHILHDVTSYASINVGRHAYTASISEAKTVDELRAEDRTHRIIAVEEAVETVRSGMPLQLHPLIGGLAPEVGAAVPTHRDRQGDARGHPCDVIPIAGCDPVLYAGGSKRGGEALERPPMVLTVAIGPVVDTRDLLAEFQH